MKGYSSYRDEKIKAHAFLSRRILQAGEVYVKKTGSGSMRNRKLITLVSQRGLIDLIC